MDSLTLEYGPMIRRTNGLLIGLGSQARRV
jgi:hypothetical protein